MPDTKIYKATIEIEIELGAAEFSSVQLPETKSVTPPSRAQMENLVGGYLMKRYGEYCLMTLECSKFEEVENSDGAIED